MFLSKIDMLTYRSVQAVFLLFFQFTRSHRGEKEKAPTNDQDDSASSDVEEGNLSLMDRTKRLAKAARDQQQQALGIPVKDEVQDLEEMVRRTRDRVKAVKSAKSRAAALRQELQDLEEEEQSVIAEDDPVPASSAPVPVAAPDPSVLVAATLKSAVIIFPIMTLFISHARVIIRFYFVLNLSKD